MANQTLLAELVNRMFGAIKLQHNNSIKVLIDQASIYKIDIREFRPVFEKAIELGYFEAAEEFIASGVMKDSDKKFDFTNIMYYRPYFHNMAAKGEVNAMRFLLDHGFSPSEFATKGCPIHYAASHNQLESIKFLIDVGVDVNNVIHNGRESPLTISAKNNFFEGINYLVSQGADVNHLNNNDESPLFLASCHNNFEAIDLLIKKGADIKQAITSAIEKNNKKVIKALLKSGVNPNTKTDVNTQISDLLLLIEAKDGRAKNTEALIKCGANVNCKNEQGTTPFLKAAQSNSIRTLEILVANGADIHHVDNQGNNAFFYAVSVRKTNLEFFQYLVEIGVKPSFNQLHDLYLKDYAICDFMRSLREKSLLFTSLNNDGGGAENFQSNFSIL